MTRTRTVRVGICNSTPVGRVVSVADGGGNSAPRGGGPRSGGGGYRQIEQKKHPDGRFYYIPNIVSLNVALVSIKFLQYATHSCAHAKVPALNAARKTHCCASVVGIV